MEVSWPWIELSGCEFYLEINQGQGTSYFYYWKQWKCPGRDSSPKTLLYQWNLAHFRIPLCSHDIPNFAQLIGTDQCSCNRHVSFHTASHSMMPNKRVRCSSSKEKFKYFEFRLIFLTKVNIFEALLNLFSFPLAILFLNRLWVFRIWLISLFESVTIDLSLGHFGPKFPEWLHPMCLAALWHKFGLQ